MTFRVKLMIIPLLLSVANCAHVIGPSASAQTPDGPSGGAEPTGQKDGFTSYVWHDGDREHRIWMDSNLIAEVAPRGTQHPSLGQATVRADVRTGAQSVRYWQLDSNATADQTLKKLATDHVPGRFSPVWHDSPSADGPIRILPGNIIVILDQDWNEEAVTRWLERHQLRMVSRLPFGPNMLLIESDAGLPALQLANQLYSSGEVKAAFPDWLSQKTLK